MGKSKVFFANLRARGRKDSKTEKVGRLFDAAGFSALIEKDALVAIKMHFGEKGGDGFISPLFVRRVVDCIKQAGGKPFLTDTNTLYTGSRHNAVDHLQTAIEHGFDYAVVNAPVIIADGLLEENESFVHIGKKHVTDARIASTILKADSMIVLSHFKGHELAGFGGAIKNLAMGCATANGKKEQHSPRMDINQANCTGCRSCMQICPANAICMAEGKAVIDKAICIGCGQCLTVCEYKAVFSNWAGELGVFNERIAEYAYAAVKKKKSKTGYLSFLMNITPDCDCVPFSDAPLVPDIGILASCDPVALDQASYDLVNKMSGHVGSHLKCNHEPGCDKFSGVWESTHGITQLVHGEEIGLGFREYELQEI